MGKEWIPYYCKSGQLIFLYNKATGEHKWPYALKPVSNKHYSLLEVCEFVTIINFKVV